VIKTVLAEIDENGNVTPLAPLQHLSKRRALVTIFDEGDDVSGSALLSEPTLAEDWNGPGEDAAWAHLQRLAQ
jgi:hypothetical protein